MMIVTTEQYDDMLRHFGLKPSGLQHGKTWLLNEGGIHPMGDHHEQTDHKET